VVEASMGEERAKLMETLKEGAVVRGVVKNITEYGAFVDLGGIDGLLHLTDMAGRRVRHPSEVDQAGQETSAKIIKLDQKRNNVVVSRRAVMEAANSVEREELLRTLEEGMVRKGIVKNLTDYGAFVDLGGIDGLLHITDMSWKRVKHPSEVVEVGDEIEVKVLKFDRERNRVSLGLKQLGEDPWSDIVARYPRNARVPATVTNLTDYGCFAELEDGVEGLVHVSEMDWTNKNVHPSKVVQIGDRIEVMILDIDEERRRISLGMKQCLPNPWEEFGVHHAKNEVIRGTIKSITDFGVFIGLEGGIDGLVHLSDISWNQTGEEAIRNFHKGDEIETVILAIDPERERISLGIKQLADDPFSNYVARNDKGSVVKGVVREVDAKGAVIDLGDDIEAQLKASEISRDRVEDARNALSVGDEVEAQIIRAIDACKREGLLKTGDRIVIAAGLPVQIPGTTNLLRVLDVE